MLVDIDIMCLVFDLPWCLRRILGDLTHDLLGTLWTNFSKPSMTISYRLIVVTSRSLVLIVVLIDIFTKNVTRNRDDPYSKFHRSFADSKMAAKIGVDCDPCRIEIIWFMLIKKIANQISFSKAIWWPSLSLPTICEIVSINRQKCRG